MNRAGKYVKNLLGIASYDSFQPSPLPPVPAIEMDGELSNLIKKAYLLLGELNGISNNIPNIDLFIAMYIRKEALLSSQIEGTQATLDDIFDPRIEANSNLDVEEVINYIKSFNYAKERIFELPISIRLIKEVHKILLDGRRGEDKQPGELRQSQNWIGPRGSNLRHAMFIPPNVEDMISALNNFEKFIHDSDNIDPLIKIALIHYQFETIHPFLDGNGRIGRLLIALLLKYYDLIQTDVIYVSYYLKMHQLEYYARLNEVRQSGDYEQWIKFFLKAIIGSTQHSMNTIKELRKLHQTNVILLEGFDKRRRRTVEEIIDYMSSYPITDIASIVKHTSRTFTTISNAIYDLIDQGILVQLDEKKSHRIYCYEPYLAILREGTELR
jgi:Fic family protein